MTARRKSKALAMTRRGLTGPAAVFKGWLAVPPSAARALAEMWAARGRAVTRAALMKSSGQTSAGLNLSVKLLRAAMDVGAIETLPGEGYFLSAIGLAECRRALADAEQVRSAA